MICPKWLVQSSTLGVMSAALIAAPLWIASTDHDDSTDRDRPSYAVSEVPYPVAAGAESTDDVSKLEETDDEPDIRIHRTRYGITETAPGPRCMVPPSEREQQALDRADSVVDDSLDEAGDVVDTPDENDNPLRIRFPDDS